MKQKDIILVVVVVIVTGLFTTLVTNFLFEKPSDRKESVEVVEPITADFKQPDDRYFNNDAINPSKTIQIGDSQNPQPFGNN